ncbi:uncharacterized protein [Maniola hyperantus]|uniref:uncharacterized protein isoform X2 n=1 Tax=Aphantopus hyperantus TaxID=2795564 RepID=UPI00374A5483
MDSEEGVPVDLYIYDLTNGLASLLSPSILGRQVEGVWHTAVVVFEREYFYGGAGVTSCAPGSTQLGAPHRVERLGATFVPFPVFNEYIQGLATTTYTGEAYRLLEHNCNHFSDEVAQFVCGARIPKHILAQPERDLPPPLRLALQAMLDKLVPDGDQVYANGVRHSRRDSPDFLTLNHQIEEARLAAPQRSGVRAICTLQHGTYRTRQKIMVASQELDARRSTLTEKLARKERRKEKKRKKLRDRNGGDAPDADDDMAEAVEPRAALAGPSSRDLDAEADERRQEEQRRRERDPPLVYRDIDVSVLSVGRHGGGGGAARGAGGPQLARPGRRGGRAAPGGAAAPRAGPAPRVQRHRRECVVGGQTWRRRWSRARRWRAPARATWTPRRTSGARRSSGAASGTRPSCTETST